MNRYFKIEKNKRRTVARVDSGATGSYIVKSFKLVDGKEKEQDHLRVERGRLSDAEHTQNRMLTRPDVDVCEIVYAGVA